MTDEQVDFLIGTILRWGVTVSAVIVATGGAWYLIESGSRPVDYRYFQPVRGPAALFGLPAPELVMLSGLLLLIATPVVRVVFSVFAFALERDWMYVVFTLIVLAILLTSILSGL